MPNVKQILASKPARGTLTVDASFTVHAAVGLLASHGIGALVVTEHGKPVGIFSERDFARKGIIRGRRSHETPVRELMSAPLITVGPEHSMEDCMELMTSKRIRHLPVEDGGELVGMVTIGDVLLQIVQAQKSTIDQLQGYITGKY
ncbi:MAG: CBS domain-containing protein [Gammaproteobacteria bacterium]